MVRADGYVKVLDFGLARVVDHQAAERSTIIQDTEPGTVLGTTAYMSPEQARGEQAGPAADIFAFGVVLYELSAGRRPFVAPSAPACSRRFFRAAGAARRLNPAIPPALDALVHRMLAKEAERRPSAREVDEELAALARARDSARRSRARRRPDVRKTVGRETERARIAAGLCAGQGRSEPDRWRGGRGRHRQDAASSRTSSSSWRRGPSGRSSRAAAAPSGWPAQKPICRFSKRSTACCTGPAASRCRR